MKAAENFFRPEFFNRIDRVIPFDSLSRDEMRKIAELVLADVFQRDGLVRRRCALSVEPQAMERIVDAGYHPHFGARALKRAIERQFVQPVAASLAGVKPELPAVISIYPQPEGVTAAVQPLKSVQAADPPLIAELEPAEQLDRVERYLARVEDEIDAARPPAAAGRGIPPEQLRYYALKEQLHCVREMADGLTDAALRASRGAARPQIAPKSSAGKQIIRGWLRTIPTHRLLRDIQAAKDLHDYLHEAAAAIPRPEELQERLTRLRHEAALLHSLVTSAGTPDRALVAIRPLVKTAADNFPLRLELALLGLFEALGYACERGSLHEPGLLNGLLISGPGIWPLVQPEVGIHIYCRRHQNLLPIQVSVLPDRGGSATEQCQLLVAERQTWLDDVAAGRADAHRDPWPLGQIVRFYDEGGPTLDLRTGQSLTHWPAPAERKSLLAAGLPLPPELEA